MYKMDLFGFEDNIAPQTKAKPKMTISATPVKKVDPNAYKTHITQFEEKYRNDDYILDYLSKKANLWDMRCWNKLKSLEEIKEKIIYINDPHDICGILNDGHACFLIRTYLKKYNNDELSTNRIIRCFMENKNVSFEKRLTACWIDNMKCPRFVAFLNYAECHCSTICNNKS